MTYDFHGIYDNVTGHNAPLFASKMESNQFLNQDGSVEAWINAGASPSKILLGLPFYGHQFKLLNRNLNGVSAAISGPGEIGPYSRSTESIMYMEVCKAIMSNYWSTVFDAQQQVPYAYANYDWISYENIRSISVKCKYSIYKQLGGVMIWAIDQDDRSNTCGDGEMPLLTAVNKIIRI